MDVPTSGPIVEKHNNIIMEKQTYSFFIRNDGNGFRIVNTSSGALVVAYSDQALAKKVFDRALGDQYTLMSVENADMPTFYNMVVNDERAKQAINGILLNLPVALVTSSNVLIPNDQILLHLFTREELQPTVH